MATNIHSTAVIAPGAELGTDVEIGPYTVVGPQVRIGDRTRIGPQVMLDGVTEIGEANSIVGQASLGTPPQDFSYKGEDTRLIVGDRNTIREFVTINRGTIKGGGVTRIGSDNLLMACCHVAHDCELEDRVILGNGVLLAGHTRVEHHANLSGMAGAVAFITIGAHAYIGGMTRMSKDVPPYMIVDGHDSRVRGVNTIGLKRAGFTPEAIEELRLAHRKLWRSGGARGAALQELREEPDLGPHVRYLIESMDRTDLGLKGRYRESQRQYYSELGVRRILEGEAIS
ncbi:MAG: UDP-N-acetylglucosamine acyltransferase [Planctomycetota bacterium]|jgi:UDP-N-acetylglucosamine acyltransferase